MLVILNEDLVKEAERAEARTREYWESRKKYGYFRKGDERSRAFYYGKLGEKALKQIFNRLGIVYTEDNTVEDKDSFDFTAYFIPLNRISTIDVKTRCEIFHRYTLETERKMRDDPKDIYVSAFLKHATYPVEVELIGFATPELFKEKKRILFEGDQRAYALLDDELYPIRDLFNNFTLKKERITA